MAAEESVPSEQGSAWKPEQEPIWARLDLEQPDLAAVRAAALEGDYEAATKALADHLRGRRGPVYYQEGQKPVEPLEPESNDRRLLPGTDAEEALTNSFTVIGKRRSFTAPHVYAFPPGGARTQDDDNWMQQFNRHQAWVMLAKAWGETGNPIYSKKAAELVGQWLNEAPYPAPDKPGEPSRFSPTWRTIEAGIRSGQVWPVAFSMLRRSPDLSDELLVRWMNSFADHAEYLMANRGGGNWRLFEAEGLLTCGVMFPEFKGAKKWRDQALDWIDEESGKQLLADGGQFELTPWYHYGALKSLQFPVTVAQKNGHDAPADLNRRIEKMYEWLMNISDPTGTAPALNDSEWLGVREILKSGAARFPGRGDLLYVGTGGAEGRQPDHDSILLPSAGTAVMRTGWGNDDSYLLFEGGAYGAGGHQHEDKLGFMLHACGQRFLADTGRNKYDGSALHRHALSARAHSTIAVDGLEQNRRPSWEKLLTMETGPDRWYAGPEFDYVCATYGRISEEGWGKTWTDQSQPLATHRREILFAKPDVWVVVDILDPAPAGAGSTHSYEGQFQFDASVDLKLEAQEGPFLATGKNGATLTLSALPVEGLRLRTAAGEKDPYLGWQLSETKPPVPAPVAAFKISSVAGPVVLAWAFVATPPGTAARAAGIVRLPDPAPGQLAFKVSVPGKPEFSFVTATDPAAKSLAWDGKDVSAAALVSMDHAVYPLGK